jgi:hypothetical protein
MRVGDLPEPGRWVKLSVPASAMRLSGSTIDGMAFSVYGGRVWFDRAGVTACAFPPPAAPALGSGDTVWIDDDPPAGAALSGSWSWDTSQNAGGTRSMANPAWNGPRQFWFSGVTTRSGLRRPTSCSCTSSSTRVRRRGRSCSAGTTAAGGDSMGVRICSRSHRGLEVPADLIR